MLKFETTWIRHTTTEEGRPIYTETQQWWRDPADDSWTHVGHMVAGQHVSRAFSSGFAAAYADEQRAMLEATGWNEINPGTEAFDVRPLTVAEIKRMRAAWFKKVVRDEPAA